MLYNLRSDIIYYKTASDFELEFNLCGCCRMRLLTDKPSNKKAFVHSLARAVSRSRVILVAGALFGAESTVKTVAQALGTQTEIADNATFNISSDDEIEIIKGSVPLVSSDGSFGGCIIESGPQTMILLTDNKTLRKSIMTSLIHPYITELYEAENNAKNAPKSDENSNNTAPISQANPDEISIEELITEDTAEETDFVRPIEDVALVLEDDNNITDFSDTNTNIDADTLIIEEAEETNPDDAEIIFTPPELILDYENDAEDEDNTDNIEHKTVEEYQNIFNTLFTNNEKSDDEYDNKPIPQNDYLFLNDDGDIMDNKIDIPRKEASALSLATIIITAILLLAIVVLCYCIFAVAGNEGVSPSEYIQTVWQSVFG